MNNNRVGYRFAILGLVSLAFGIACVGWAPLLGGFSFVGATASVFLAMLSFCASWQRFSSAVAGCSLHSDPGSQARVSARADRPPSARRS